MVKQKVPIVEPERNLISSSPPLASRYQKGEKEQLVQPKEITPHRHCRGRRGAGVQSTPQNPHREEEHAQDDWGQAQAQNFVTHQCCSREVCPLVLGHDVDMLLDMLNLKIIVSGTSEESLEALSHELFPFRHLLGRRSMGSIISRIRTKPS